MSILSGEEIRRSIAEKTDATKRLVITPFFDDSVQLDGGSASIDLRLGCRFSVAKRRGLTHFPAYSEEVHPRTLVDEHYVPLGGKFVLHPHQFVLGVTFEWIRLPPTLGGYILGRSTFGRRGLIIATAAGVHPNYSGVLTLELTNLAEIPIEVTPGQSICQLFLHDVSGWSEETVDRSVFLGSLHPRLGASRADPIGDFLRSIDSRKGPFSKGSGAA